MQGTERMDGVREDGERMREEMERVVGGNTEGEERR